MEPEIESVIKWFKENVFLFDNNNHTTLKKSDFDYVEGKIYFTYPFLEIFEAWRKTKPENLYDKDTFLNWCINQWIARLKNKEYYIATTMAHFYQAWDCHNKKNNYLIYG